jgi:hypothetical protein
MIFQDMQNATLEARKFSTNLLGMMPRKLGMNLNTPFGSMGKWLQGLLAKLTIKLKKGQPSSHTMVLMTQALSFKIKLKKNLSIRINIILDRVVSNR